MTRRNIVCKIEAKLGICPVRILWGAFCPILPPFAALRTPQSLLDNTRFDTTHVRYCSCNEDTGDWQMRTEIYSESFQWRSHLGKPKCRREGSRIAHYSVRRLLFSARRWNCGCRKSLEIFDHLKNCQLVENKSELAEHVAREHTNKLPPVTKVSGQHLNWPIIRPGLKMYIRKSAYIQRVIN